MTRRLPAPTHLIGVDRMTAEFSGVSAQSTIRPGSHSMSLGPLGRAQGRLILHLRPLLLVMGTTTPTTAVLIQVQPGLSSHRSRSVGVAVLGVTADIGVRVVSVRS